MRLLKPLVELVGLIALLSYVKNSPPQRSVSQRTVFFAALGGTVFGLILFSVTLYQFLGMLGRTNSNSSAGVTILNPVSGEAEKYYQLGLNRYDASDYQGAIDNFSRAIQLDRNHAKAYYERGNSKYSLKDLQSALEDYNKAIQLQPDFSYAYNQRGNVKFDLKDTQGALADYSRAIQLQPDLVEPYYGRGLARSSLGNRQGAISDYQKAIRLYESQGNTQLAQEVRGHLRKIQ